MYNPKGSEIKNESPSTLNQKDNQQYISKSLQKQATKN